MADGIEKSTIAWHPAFCSAAEFDLRAERASLTFEAEHNLSKEPLRMDLLIIKKQKEDVIDNDIARIFRRYNVIEYKSPDDGLTIDDFYKTIGYACIYKGLARTVDEIPADELTVSVFRDSYPKKLIDTLAAAGTLIEKTSPGVYSMKDMKPFPAQIVVTKELAPEKHAGLRILSRNVSEADIEAFILQAEAETLHGEKLNIDAILEVSNAANEQVFIDLKRRNQSMSDALRRLMKDEIETAERNGAIEKSKEMAINLNRQGVPIEVIANAAGVTVDVIRMWLGLQSA